MFASDVFLIHFFRVFILIKAKNPTITKLTMTLLTTTY